jgi:deazaflavin-dependent oxidoreductase (nitroreductase family)
MIGGITPRPLLKWTLRAPVSLYAMHAGWLLGHRFLLLTHRGRQTGRLHRTVLEVIAWRSDTREAVVMSGFGPSSQWYKNVLAGGASEVRIARLCFIPHARPLEPQEATEVIADYERRNRIVLPLIRVVASRLAGFPYDGSDSARLRLAGALPLVAFRPRD